MTLSLDENKSLYQILGYKPGFIQINQEILSNSIIITPNLLIKNWEPQTVKELTSKHWEKIIPLKPAILILGTGSTLEFPSLEVYGELINQGIGVEIMDTSAACRTYNVLTAEERNVAAALIIK